MIVGDFVSSLEFIGFAVVTGVLASVEIIELVKLVCFVESEKLRIRDERLRSIGSTDAFREMNCIEPNEHVEQSKLCDSSDPPKSAVLPVASVISVSLLGYFEVMKSIERVEFEITEGLAE